MKRAAVAPGPVFDPAVEQAKVNAALRQMTDTVERAGILSKTVAQDLRDFIDSNPSA